MGSEDLERSLRAEIDGYINGRLDALRDEISRLQSQMNEAFTRLSERVQGEAQSSDASVAVSISEHLRAARNTGIETAATEGTRARASSDLAIMKAAVDDIDSQRSQADILNALVNRAASFAPRVAFFVIRQERATGWRARGLEGTVGDDSIRELSVPLSADTLLSAVARSRTAWSGAPGTHAEDHTIYNHFGADADPPQRIVAIPLVAREKTVAVLYADSDKLDSDAVGLEALETLTRVAGMAVELLATKRPASTDASKTAAAHPSPAPESASAAAPAREAEPESSTDAAPAVAVTPDYEPEAATHTSSVPFTRDEPAPQPVTSMPQAETVDAPTVETSSHADTGMPASGVAAPSAPAPPPAGRRGVELPIEVGEADRARHMAAMRYARVLIGDVKLYNEKQVEEGRRDGDLYRRLREDLDRARESYDNDKRVTPDIAARFDYFHHVLVDALAQGDEAKLGEDYPGASVRE